MVPGHVGIRGNEAADRAAKETLDKKTDSRSHAFFRSDLLFFFSRLRDQREIFRGEISVVTLSESESETVFDFLREIGLFYNI